MKKINHTFLMLLISSLAFAQFPSPYCGPLTFTTNVEPITLVDFAGINNPSSFVTGGAAHQDFTDQTAQVTAGQTYPIALKGNTDGNFINLFSVYMDWNHDNDFSDQGEAYYIGSITNSNGTDSISLLGNITIPGTALAGITRMRVLKVFEQSLGFMPTSCNTNLAGYGEAEDYTVDVTAITQCLTGINFPTSSITPISCDGSMTTISNQSMTGQYFTVNVQSGQSYTFQSSISTDYFTASTDGGLTADYAGTSPFVWQSNTTGLATFYLHSNINCGVDAQIRTTSLTCGTACLNGPLFPATTYSPPTCDSVTQNLITANAFTGQYSNIQVQTGSTYTFSSSMVSDYITLSADGLTALVEGTGPITWQSNFTGAVRFYIHSNQFCGVDSTTRSKFVSCELLALPGCVSNLFITANDTVYVSIGTYAVNWDLPTTGGLADSAAIYIGLDSINSILEFPAIPTPGSSSFGFDATDIGTTYYYWIVLFNAAGEAICTPEIGVIYVLANPISGMDENAIDKINSFPNPVKDKLTLGNVNEPLQARILNSLGQVVMHKTINKTNSDIDLAELDKGIYFLQLSNKTQHVKTLKIVKE
jgi:hypothetical protein